MILVLSSGCTQSPAATTPSPSSQSAKVLAGGCAGTVFTDAEPPKWAQGGWSHTSGTLWPVPWALATSSDALAFLFATRLVAGASPRVDGSNNKVLWLMRDAAAFGVEGRPIGQSNPVVSVEGGPSIVDVPQPGCWSFKLIAKGSDTRVRTINIDVLPTGAVPV